MISYLEAKNRVKLLKELEPRYSKAKLVLLGERLEINSWNFSPDFYLIVENAEIDGNDRFHLIITLNPQVLTSNVNALTMKTYLQKFSCWWIPSPDLEYMKRHLKPISTFLYGKY